VLVALIGLGLAWALVIVTWPDAVLGLTFDDAFYYFEIGLRLARGQGSTFDGLHATNGYHPLWILPCAVAHLLAPPGDGVVRGLLILQVLLALGGTAWALSGLRWSRAVAGASVLAAAVLVAWFAVPMVTRTHVNGLESAVVVAVHGGILALTLRHGACLHTWSAARRWLLGGLLGLALLARTDGALLTPLILLWTLPAAWSDRGSDGLLRLVPVGLPPAAVLGAFLVLNQVWFGAPMQVSGTLKRVSPGVTGSALIAGCLLAALGLAWLVRSGRLDGARHLSHVLRDTGFHACFVLVTLGYYTGLQTFARQWYFAPAVLWGTLLLVAGALDLAAKARADAPDTSPVRALLPVGGILVVPLLVGAGLTGWQLAAPETLAVRKADRAAARWLDAHLPPGTRVGSWDAGLIGYHTDQPVVNLDGVVNDVDWLHALRTGRAGERLADEDVGWIVNHSLYAQGDCTTITQGLELLRAAPPAQVVQAWPYEQAGRLNGGEWGRHAMATCVVRLEGSTPP